MTYRVLYSKNGYILSKKFANKEQALQFYKRLKGRKALIKE